MKKANVLLGASIVLLLSCGKQEMGPLTLSEEIDDRPLSCVEYEEMLADGGVVLKEDHFATCPCPIRCHFDDFK